MAGKSEIIGSSGANPPAHDARSGISGEVMEPAGNTAVAGEHDTPRQAEAAPGAETAQREQRVRRAREAAAALIEELTAGQGLSFEVNQFLHDTWSPVLVRTHLATGPESTHWKHLARIGATLVWTMKPKHSEAERNKILKMIPSMLRALSRGMDLVKIDNAIQDRIFRMLAQQHALVVKLTARNIAAGETAEARASAEALAEVERTPAERVIEHLEQFIDGVSSGDLGFDEDILLLGEAEPEPEPARADDWAALAGGLELGSWVEFSESPSRVLLARLSWKSQVSGNLVFVNRKGQRVRSMTIDELAGELGAGRATRVEASSVFDIAVYAIMNKLAG